MRMTHKSIIYPIFLPHAGCPFLCVYCNQRAVTSVSPAISSSDVASCFRQQFGQILTIAQERCAQGELAFYGGTFTALSPPLVEEILETVAPWVHAGTFSGIRFSTRPDRMTENISSRLKDYPIATVELGVQSFVDEVLALSRRGYTGETAEKAALLVQRHGWRLGLQLMPGLPGDSKSRFLNSIARAIRFRPDFVRIYPTLVITGTQLADWYRAGTYHPLSLDEAVSWCVPAYDALFREHVPIARLGLHPDPELQKPGTVLAGPYHPAFGYLVRVQWWRDRVRRRVEANDNLNRGTNLTLRVSARSVSEVIGPGHSNVRYWQENLHLNDVGVKIEDDLLPGQFKCLFE